VSSNCVAATIDRLALRYHPVCRPVCPQLGGSVVVDPTLLRHGQSRTGRTDTSVSRPCRTSLRARSYWAGWRWTAMITYMHSNRRYMSLTHIPRAHGTVKISDIRPPLRGMGRASSAGCATRTYRARRRRPARPCEHRHCGTGSSSRLRYELGGRGLACRDRPCFAHAGLVSVPHWILSTNQVLLYKTLIII